MRQNHRAPLLSLLGLARRAGKLSLGNDAAVESLRKGQARLVLLASGSALPGNRGLDGGNCPGNRKTYRDSRGERRGIL